MKNMLLSYFVLLVLSCLVVFSACAPAQKPAEERIVVPEVSKVFVETVDIKEAPSLVQDLAQRMEGKDANLAVEVGGKVWLVVSREDEDEIVEIKEVIERVISQDTTILEIKLSELEKEEENKEQAKTLVAKLSANSLNSGTVFYSEEEAEERQESTTVQEETKQAVKNGGASSQTSEKLASKTEDESTSTFQVYEPKPNQVVESPLKVSGQARVANSIVTVRLRDNRGNILAETETVAGEDKKFSVTLDFTKPQETKGGRLEVFAPNAPGGSSANTTVIPVTFK